jgi:transcriptional regulator with XRE-family HTH domain
MTNTPLITNIKNLMKANEVSEQELADNADINHSTLHRILSGGSENPRLSTLVVIAKFFDVSVDYLTSDVIQKTVEVEPDEDLTPAARKLVLAIRKNNKHLK